MTVRIGDIYESTDKRRAPRRIRVDSIETWYDPQAGWEADYAVVSDSKYIPFGGGSFRRGWTMFKGQKYLLTDHLTSRHNWKLIRRGK